MEPELFQPKKRFWICGPTYDLGEKEFRVIWDDLIVGMGLGDSKEIKLRKAYNKRTGDMYIEFPWQTRLEVRTAAYSKEKNLIGEGLDGMILSEAAKHDSETWDKYLRPALSDKRGWASFATTPEGFNWFYHLWRYGKDVDYPEYESWRFPSWENEVVYPLGDIDPEILLLARTLTKEEFAQEIGADFTATTGRIYTEFSEETHVRRTPFNPAWPNYCSIDFGWSHPLAAVEFQVSPSDTVHIWREHYGSGMMLEDHLMRMQGREQPPGYHLDLTFGDSASPQDIEVVNRKFGPCIGMPEAKVNWREGIDLVKSFLKLNQVGEDEYERPVEEPHLFVDPSCENTIREYNTYRTRESKTDMTESNTAGAAFKVGDDCMDAIRYGLMHVFKLGVTGHLYDVLSPSALLVPESPATVGSISGDAGFFTTGMKF